MCDVLLPQKSGFEVCFEIKRAPETRDVPVIFMSAVCKDAYSEDVRLASTSAPRATSSSRSR